MLNTAHSEAPSARRISGPAKGRSLRGAAKRASARARSLELQVWKHLEAGKTPTAIALELGIARPSVHRIIRRVDESYRARIFETVDRVKREQFARLHKLVEDAEAGWERSTRVGERIGDSKFIEAQIKAMRDIRRLCGIDAKTNRPAVGDPRANQRITIEPKWE